MLRVSTERGRPEREYRAWAWTCTAQWPRASSRSGKRSAGTSRRSESGARRSPSTGTGSGSSTCGPAPGTSTARPPGSAAPHRSCARRRRASPPPYSCCCTSADSWTWTRRWATTGRSSRRGARSGCWSGTSLNHRAGLPVLDRPLTPQQAIDPLRGPEAVAAQAPAWEPGTDHGYHALTYGWLLDELVRRVTGQGTGRVARGTRSPARWAWTSGSACRSRRPAGWGTWAASRAPEPTGGLRSRPKRVVTEAYEDPGSLTRRAFAAITPFPDAERPRLPRGRPARDQRHRDGGRTGPLLRDADRRRGRRCRAPLHAGDGGAGPGRGVGGTRPGPGGRHPLRPRLHAARQRLAAS